MKNIIFIAPPAAGKGTQSKLVSEEYNIPHISTGDLLREEATKPTKLGKQIKETMENTIKLSVPLEVDIETGTNWYDAK